MRDQVPTKTPSTLAVLPEQTIRLSDPSCGLDGFIVLHSTRLGPAAGGCRLWHYDEHSQACSDAMRLAHGMALKNALAGLPLGGGKAVLRKPEGRFDRQALFSAFGRAVEEAGGSYVTAEDVGTSVEDMEIVGQETSFVAGRSANGANPGGDPSPWTARGVFNSMKVSVAHRMSADLCDVTVAVQGLGHVGWELCRLLSEAGAKLVVAELSSEIAARAANQFGAELMGSSARALANAKADVVAPCALGGTVTREFAETTKAKVICGAANNQLSCPEAAPVLEHRGVLYAPDFLVNAGGIINVAGEYLRWSGEEVERRVDAIPNTLKEVLKASEETGHSPVEQAVAKAERVLTASPRLVRHAA